MVEVIHKYTNGINVVSRKIPIRDDNNPLRRQDLAGYKEIKLAAKIAELLISMRINATVIVDSNEMEIKVRFQQFGEFLCEFLIYFVGQTIWAQYKVDFKHVSSIVTSTIDSMINSISYYIREL